MMSQAQSHTRSVWGPRTPELLPKLGVLLAAALLVGCGGGGGGAGEGVAPPVGPTADQGRGKEPLASALGGPRDTLVIAYQSDADSLLSVVSQSAADSDIMGNLFYPLLNAHFDCELKYEPGVATEVSFSEDSKVLTMKLRDDILWADGKPVTAEDIKFTMDLVADPVVASPRLAFIERMDPAGRPKIVDPNTIEWHFTNAYDQITMIAHTSSVLVAPKHVLGNADRATLRGNPITREPLVNGPFKLEKWDPNQAIVLAPNDKFTGPETGRPRLQRVIFKITPEYATRLLELQNGSVDMMQGILVRDADRLRKEHPEVELHRRGWRSMDYLAWNAFDPEDYKAQRKSLTEGQELDWTAVKPHPIFGDRAVRRALTKAVDVDKLIADLLTSESGEAYGRRATGTITPALCNIFNDSIVPLPYAPAEARAELERLGWTDSNSDGVLDKDGQDLAFNLLINSGNPRRAQASIIMQALFKEVGVKMEIQQVESNTFFERLRKKDYEAALSGWSAGLFVDMSSIWHSGDKYEFNFVGYNNPKVDRLIQQALSEPDPAANARLWQQVQQLVYEDQPYTFLYWMDEIVGVHERFRDVKVNVSSPIDELWTWWVPADKVKYK